MFSFFREICLIFTKENAIIYKKGGGFILYADYNNLWKLLIDKGMKKTDLKESCGISYNVIAKLSNNEFVSMDSLYKICICLKCDIGDVVTFNPNFKEI